MKKTIIALAAASSVALSHGVAVADEDTNTNTAASSQQSVAGSSTTGNEAKPGDNATLITKPKRSKNYPQINY